MDSGPSVFDGERNCSCSIIDGRFCEGFIHNKESVNLNSPSLVSHLKGIRFEMEAAVRKT